MQIALFLHLYQPPTQFPEVLAQIVNQSYQPILETLEDSPQVKITVNLPASLTEQLAARHRGVLAKFRQLSEKGQIELTGTAAYHAFLPKLPPEEILRQIKVNEEINTRLWAINSQRFPSHHRAGASRIDGFFPPEMAINGSVVSVAKESGYTYILADEAAIDGQKTEIFRESHIFTERQSGIKVVVRHHELSLDVAFSRIHSVSELLSRFRATSSLRYLVLAMDGETFGHHRPEQLDFLKEIFGGAVPAGAGGDGFRLVRLSELVRDNPHPLPVAVKESTWAESLERWENPKNPIHVYQWRLLNLAIDAVTNYPERDERFGAARALLDKGLHSDQFWWAARNPCWHYRMVERGAALLLSAVTSLKDLNESVKRQKREAQELYTRITKTALELYGDTTIAC